MASHQYAQHMMLKNQYSNGQHVQPFNKQYLQVPSAFRDHNVIQNGKLYSQSTGELNTHHRALQHRTFYQGQDQESEIYGITSSCSINNKGQLINTCSTMINGHQPRTVQQPWRMSPVLNSRMLSSRSNEQLSPAAPTLHISEKNHATNADISQDYKGQINLLVTLNKDFKLKILVSKAIDLQQTTDEKPYNTFVQVSLVDSAKPMKMKSHKTSVVKNSINPEFNEKFAFKLKKKDQEKRLIVTVYEQDNKTKVTSIIGCTSFGINNLIKNKNTIDGWYYLLNQSLGSKKHLQVSDLVGKEQQKMPLSNSYSSSCYLTRQLSHFSI